MTVVEGWVVSGRHSDAALTLTDCTPLTKVAVRVALDAAPAEVLGAGLGRAVRHPPTDGAADEVLVVGSGPGEWLLLGPPGTGGQLVALAGSAVRESAGLLTVLDLTHGSAVLRLTGSTVADLLAEECAIDLSDRVFPDGTAVRCPVAGLAAGLVRVDRGGTRSYLVQCERSYGQYLFDALCETGADHGLEVDGFRLPWL